MISEKRIRKAQQLLKEHELDGWLLYDFKKSNSLAHRFLNLPSNGHYSRRFFYWIPASGDPVIIPHKMEQHLFEGLYHGESRPYVGWKMMKEVLEELLSNSHAIAMEYSPEGQIPYLSKVDAGTAEFIKNYCNVEIVSSAAYLLHFTAEMTPEQMMQQKKAGESLNKIMHYVWGYINDLGGKKLSEYQLQQEILRQFEIHSLETDVLPICAFGANTAIPHYSPTESSSRTLCHGDVVLIDIFAKQKEKGSIYADITNMGFFGEQPTDKVKEVFSIVLQAQSQAVDFIKRRLSLNEIVKGFEVDEICRDFITEAGYGEYFIHRTGHNLHVDLHGPGANLDSFEMLDDRPLTSNVAFTIEPGIYIPDEFGVRLEIDVVIDSKNSIAITSGFQEKLVLLNMDENRKVV